MPRTPRLQYYWMNVQSMALSLFLPPTHERAAAPRSPDAAPAVDPPASTAESFPPTIWQGAFGPILIEVRDGAAYVNGKRVLSVSELRDSESEELTQQSG